MSKNPVVATWEQGWEQYNRSPYFKPNTAVIQHISHCFHDNLEGKKILELGAGSGSDIVMLATKDAKGYALDFSKESIKSIEYWEKKKHVTIEKKLADIHKIPYPDDFFDCVYSVGLMEHFENLIPLLTEQIRMIKPGGFLIIDVPQTYTLYTVMKHIRMIRGTHPFGWETQFSKPELISLAGKLHQKPYRIYGRESDVIQRIPDQFQFKINLIKWYSQHIETTIIAPYISLCIGLIIQVKK